MVVGRCRVRRGGVGCAVVRVVVVDDDGLVQVAILLVQSRTTDTPRSAAGVSRGGQPASRLRAMSFMRRYSRMGCSGAGMNPYRA